LTATVTLNARDTRDFKISFQMPFYPMIDDRQNTEFAMKITFIPVWNAKSNNKGWDAYLRNLRD